MTKTDHRFLAPLLLALLALTVRAQTLPGPCLIGDDGLAVPCCTPVPNINIPQFPAFQQLGKYACITNCTVVNEFPVNVTTTHQPFMGICDYALINIVVTPGSTTAPGWSGLLVAKYSRTWVEPNPTGAPARQVWRFLINGMLTPTAGVNLCPLPPHPAGANSHFHGHVDYACEFDPVNPSVAIWRMALNVNHLPGCISHDPILTQQPLPAAAAHDDRSYHLVTPDSFTFAPVPIPGGPTPAEAVRSATLGAAGYICNGEGMVFQGNITNQFLTCLCFPPVTGPFDWMHQDITGFVPCMGLTGGYAPFPLTPPLPPLPTGFASMPLGTWAGTPGIFPNGRDLVLHWGVLQYQDPCNPNDFPLHIVTGLSTTGVPGQTFQGSLPGALVFNVFMDLQHSLLLNGLLGPLTVGWGDMFFSKLVWNLNLQ